MSLNYDLKGIENWDAKATHPHEEDRMHPVMNDLIWKTMVVAMGKITKDNVDEFWWRVNFLQMFDGPEFGFGSGDDYQPIFLTKKDIEDHIGLFTNVSTKKRAEWLASLDLKPNAPKQDKSARELIAERYARLKAEGKL